MVYMDMNLKLHAKSCRLFSFFWTRYFGICFGNLFANHVDKWTRSDLGAIWKRVSKINCYGERLFCTNVGTCSWNFARHWTWIHVWAGVGFLNYSIVVLVS